MRARVKNGQWVFDAPTDMPEGTEVEIVVRVVPKGPTDVYLDDKLRAYIHALLVAASSPKYSASRVGPTAKDEADFADSAKAHAWDANRRFTTPEDIKKVAPGMMRHLVAVPDHMRGRDVSPDDVVRSILNEVEIP